MNNNHDNANEQPLKSNNEIDLLELATTLGEGKKYLILIPLVFAVLTFAISSVLTPLYTARTTILPPQTSSGGGAAALLGQVSGLAALSGLGGLGSTASNPEMFVKMMQSRSAKDALIEKFDLHSKFDIQGKAGLYKLLDDRVVFTTDKLSGLISIDVDDENPEFAASLANEYYAVLKELLGRVAVTEAQQKRVFFETQFKKASDELTKAEVLLKEAQEKTGVLQLEGQASATFQVMIQLQGEISRREAQLAALGTYATTSNPEYIRIAGELASLKRQLKDSGGNDAGVNTGEFSRTDLPERGLEYIRAFRNFKYNEAIYEVMAKQFELAKVEEAKDSSNLQQLDLAVPPENKSKPRSLLNTLIGFVIGFLLAIVYVVTKGTFKKFPSDLLAQQRLADLKQAWKFSRRD